MKMLHVLTLTAILVCTGIYAQEQPAESDFQSDVQRLEEHFSRELTELRDYLGEMMERQSDLSEKLQSVTRSGMESAEETAEEVLEKVKEQYENQLKAMQQRTQNYQQHIKELETEIAEQTRAAHQQHVAETTPTTVILKLQYANVERIIDTVVPMFDIQARMDPQTNSIIVNGTPASIEAFTHALEQLDAPDPEVSNIELRIHLLGASRSKQLELEQPSPELEEIVESIQELYPYKDMGLLESTFIRCRDGEPITLGGSFAGISNNEHVAAAQVNHQIEAGISAPNMRPGSGNSLPDGVYYFTLNANKIALEGSRIAIDALRLNLAGGKTDAAIKVDINLKNGQSAVVGKASVTGDLDAVFLVISTRIL